MVNEYNLKSIYKTLIQSGFDKNFIKHIIMPDWWRDDIANSKAGYLQALSIIAKNLGLELKDLLGDSISLNLKNPNRIKFKKAKNININETSIWPQSLSSRIINIVNQSYLVEYKELSSDPIKIRNSILDSFDNIKLDNLLDFLWQSGIPVIYISSFPRSISKMDGMALFSENRPIIILSKNRHHYAWLLFIIAHELGHIQIGHLNSAENIIFDVDISQDESDKEENEANNFALSLLTSDPEFNISNICANSAFQLVNITRKLSEELKVDPGVLILNYAFHKKSFPMAEQALKIIYRDANAVSIVQSRMKSYLKFDNLTEESFEYFARLSGIVEG